MLHRHPKHRAAHLDPLGMTFREERELLHLTDDLMQRRGWTPAIGSSSYNPPDGALLMIDSLGDHRHTWRCIPRYLGNTSMTFLHGSFVYDHTLVQITLLLAGGEQMRVSARVKRCEHVQGRAHDIDVIFTEPIEAGLILQDANDEASGSAPSGSTLTVGAQSSAESMHDTTLTGDGSNAGTCCYQTYNATVLNVEDMRLQQQLLDYLLGKFGVRVITAGTVAEGIELLASNNVDLILSDFHLTDGDAAQFATQARAIAPDTPILAVSADDHEETKRAAIKGGCDVLIAKPLTAQTVGRVLWRYLSPSDAHEPMRSTLWDDISARPLVVNFTRWLVAQMRSLVLAGSGPAEEDRKKLFELCEELRFMATGCGFEALAEEAEALESWLGSAPASADIARRAEPLLRMSKGIEQAFVDAVKAGEVTRDAA